MCVDSCSQWNIMWQTADMTRWPSDLTYARQRHLIHLNSFVRLATGLIPSWDGRCSNNTTYRSRLILHVRARFHRPRRHSYSRNGIRNPHYIKVDELRSVHRSTCDRSPRTESLALHQFFSFRLYIGCRPCIWSWIRLSGGKWGYTQHKRWINHKRKVINSR